MATRDGQSVFGGRPGTPDKAWYESYVRLATNDQWDADILRVDEDGTDSAQPTTRINCLTGVFHVPADYVDSGKLVVLVSHTKTTGNRVFDLDYRAVGAGESMDQAGTQGSVTVTVGAPAAAHQWAEAVLTFTAGHLAAGDQVEFSLYVDGTDASDTLAGAAIIYDVFFRYNDA